jgi:hypothetical protein
MRSMSFDETMALVNNWGNNESTTFNFTKAVLLVCEREILYCILNSARLEFF